jgi:small GTP-binding protein
MTSKQKYKVTIIGKSTTGKTSIVKRLKFDSFDECTECTIGVSFMIIQFKDVHYELWDTAGQERYHALLPMYFRNSKIIMFVFDLSNISSFDMFDGYIKLLSNMESYKIIVIGNKVDLVNDDDLEKEKVHISKKIDECTIKHRIYGQVFVSAKTGEGINLLVDMMYRCSLGLEYNNNDNIVLTNDNIVSDNNSKCYC